MRGNITLILKILNLLSEGFQLKFQRSKKGRRTIYEECDRIWHSIDRKQLYRTLDQLRLQKIVTIIKEGDSVEKMILTNKARAYSLRQQFKNLSIKHASRWDKKWRLVMFDIPESKRIIRNALRRKLKDIGFVEFQKSTFAYPFPCRDEINFIINFLEISEYVYYIETPIIPDHTLRKYFKSL